MPGKKRPTLLILFCGAILFLSMAGASVAPGPTALLGVFNYSGTEKAGSVDLARRLPQFFVEAVNKQEPGTVWSNEETLKKVKSAGLSDFVQVINLCTDEDFARIGRRIGAQRVAFLEIQGYSEIKREGQRKNYQVLLGLTVMDSNGLDQVMLAGEGLGDSSSDAMENAAKNLASNYLSQSAEANLGNKRDENLPVVVNLQSRQYHLPDSRHLPRPDARRDYPTRKAAELDGCLPCRVCYPRLTSGSAFDRRIEDDLGRTSCGEIEFYYRVQDAPAETARLERVAAPLVASTTRYHVDYRFRYLDDPTVNAFSAPNGFIYVTRGLMEIIESDDELAMVVAHEMAHIERKHAVVRYKQALALALIGSIFVANSDSSQEAVMTTVAVELIMKGFSREQENEADEMAVSHLKRTGLDWTAYQTLFGRFIDLRERRVLVLEAIFGTHPKAETRIENLDKMIALYQAFLGKLDS